MNKKIALLFIMFVLILAGCDQLEALKDAYTQTRVVQLLTQMPTSSPKEVEETPEVLPTVTVEQTVEVTEEITPAETATEPVVEPTFTPIATVEETPTETTTPEPTPTATPKSTDPGVYLGEPKWVDSFDENKGWAVDKDLFTSVAISGGAMRLQVLSTYDGWRLAPVSSLVNAYIETSFTTETCLPNDHFGLFVRVPVMSEADRGYLFGLTCDGRYSLREFDGKVGDFGQMVSLVPWTKADSAIPGSNQTNRIGIMTIDDNFIMFVNGQQVAEFKDNTYPQGYIGVFLGSKDSKSFAVKVDDMRYWLNPEKP